MLGPLLNDIYENVKGLNLNPEYIIQGTPFKVGPARLTPILELRYNNPNDTDSHDPCRVASITFGYLDSSDGAQQTLNFYTSTGTSPRKDGNFNLTMHIGIIEDEPQTTRGILAEAVEFIRRDK